MKWLAVVEVSEVISGPSKNRGKQLPHEATHINNMNHQCYVQVHRIYLWALTSTRRTEKTVKGWSLRRWIHCWLPLHSQPSNKFRFPKGRLVLNQANWDLVHQYIFNNMGQWIGLRENFTGTPHVSWENIYGFLKISLKSIHWMGEDHQFPICIQLNSIKQRSKSGVLLGML